MAKRQREHGTGSLFKRKGRGCWLAMWYDHTGKRRQKTTHTTDRAAALRILAKLMEDTALRKSGVVDASRDRFAVEGRKDLSEHVADYITHCRHVGHSEKHIVEKVRHLDRLVASMDSPRLASLTADALENHLHTLRDDGLSARTVNFSRQVAVAFMSWCTKTLRAETNPIKVVPKLDESRDRRRIRRPLNDDELSRLLSVAEDRGRKAWYMLAAMAGLRRGDLERLKWCDVDFEAGSITIRDGKAKRVDVLPLHPQLAEELQRLRNAATAMPTARVFAQAVTCLTVQKDMLRAGLARNEVVTDHAGNPVLVGKGKKQHAKTRIVTEDDEGRVIDLHAMRTTLGTNLARAGVAPQIAQQIMRHSDYRTTLKHYTVLRLADTTTAIEKLPKISPDERQAKRATGTHDADPSLHPIDAQQLRQQLGRETVQNGATAGSERPKASEVNQDGQFAQAPILARLGNAGQPDTRKGEKRANGFEPSTFSLEG